MPYHVCARFGWDACNRCGATGVTLGQWAREHVCGKCVSGQTPESKMQPRPCGPNCDIEVSDG